MTTDPCHVTTEVDNIFKEKVIVTEKATITNKREPKELLTTETVDLIFVAVDRFTHRLIASQGVTPITNCREILNAASVELILATIDKTTRLSGRHSTMIH